MATKSTHSGEVLDARRAVVTRTKGAVSIRTVMRRAVSGTSPGGSTCWDAGNLRPLGFLCRFGGWWRWLILTLIVGGGSTTLWRPWIGLILFAGAGGVLWWYRNPVRTIASDARSVVSPVDGWVDDVGITDGAPAIRGEALRIGIVTSPWDVRMVRAPITGTVRETLAASGGATRGSEIWLADAAGSPALFRQIPRVGARCASFACRPADQIHAGAVIGRATINSRVEIWVPTQDGYSATVWRGDRVRSGVSILARIRARVAVRSATGAKERPEPSGRPGAADSPEGKSNGFP